jgi:diacylglycerol kinase (ATP)
MKGVIIANPRAGGGRAYRVLCRHVSRRRYPGWDMDLISTNYPGQAGEIALELAANPPDFLAVCGGDGTLNEIASAIPSPPYPVAILPGGTANVLARELHVPMDPVRALGIAIKRSIRSVDLGALGPGDRRRFLFVAGIGFDAYVAARVNASLKDAVGIGAYVLAGLRCIRTYPFKEFRVTADNRSFSATSCIVANARLYGGGLVFCPEADMQDGLVDVLIFESRSRLGLIRLFFHAWIGKPQRSATVHRLQCRRLSISGPGDIPIQVDGESAGTLPVDIGLLPRTFPLCAP